MPHGKPCTGPLPMVGHVAAGNHFRASGHALGNAAGSRNPIAFCSQQLAIPGQSAIMKSVARASRGPWANPLSPRWRVLQ